MNKRVLSWLLVLMFTIAAVFSAFAEESAVLPADAADGEEAGISDFSMRFGENAVVETDIEGNPLTVNGYPYHMVNTFFNIRSVDEKIYAASDFLDYPFWQPATIYDGNLAIMSLFMSLCAARDLKRNENPDTFDPSQNVELYLDSAGFRDIRKDDYSKTTSIYTISTAMGYRTMEHDGEEPFTLIAVGVCGGGYGRYLVIRHNDGKYCTLYAHLSSVSVSVGQSVSQGEVIGYAGSTGYSTGAHLHFEVRHWPFAWTSDNAIDPEQFISNP